jgi:Holin of 3TMs, for gene-transfer release
MSWWSAITGLFRPAKELIEVFKPNAEMEAARGHEQTMALSEQDMASLQQFAAEFHGRERRTWWDSLVDGLNRLPRPLITFGVLAFFVLAPLEPARFLEIAKVYQLMPDGFWALLSVIVAFYFGGRMQLKRQDMAVKGSALLAAREILARRRAERVAEARMAPPVEAPATAEPPDAATTNRVVEEWRRRQAGTARS